MGTHSCNFGVEGTLDRSMSAEEQLCQRLRAQVEFYFSDSNLARDKQLNRMLSKSKRRFLSFRQLLKFNRIKKFMIDANVETEKRFQTLATALETSDKLELNRLKNMVKRREVAKKENPEAIQRRIQDSTCYVDGFGETVDQEQLAVLFGRFGNIKSIRLLKSKNGDSLGYCFIEFADSSQMATACKSFKSVSNRSTLPLKTNCQEIRVIPLSVWTDNNRSLSEVS